MSHSLSLVAPKAEFVGVTVMALSSWTCHGIARRWWRQDAHRFANGTSSDLNILLLSYYYPPDRAVGGQRAQKVAEALSAAGHDVTVIAAGITAAESQGLVRIKPIPSARELWAWLQSRGQQAKGPEASGDKPAIQVGEDTSRQVARWKRWIFSLIWLPDDRQGYILPAVWRAMRDPKGKPDLIYSTAPPFSVHLAGLLLKGLTGATWVAEFRDPWTTNPWKPAELRSALTDWLDRKFEWVCLETADLLVPVSDGIASRHAETGTATPFTVVRNGIEKLRTAEELEADAEADGPFEIVHAGSFYHARDPFPFLAAVRQLVESNSLSPADLHVRFIGATQTYKQRSIADFVRAEGLDDYVTLDDWMQPDRSLRHVTEADLLLLLAMDQPDQVPNKLYEYLGVRRPILAVADAGGETVRMLDLAGGHLVVPINKAEHIRRALERLLVRKQSRGPVGHSGVLENWTTSAQMARLRAALGALDSESHNSS